MSTSSYSEDDEPSVSPGSPKLVTEELQAVEYGESVEEVSSTPEMFPSLMHSAFSRQPQSSPAVARRSWNPISPGTASADFQEIEGEPVPTEEDSFPSDEFASPMLIESTRRPQPSPAAARHSRSPTPSKPSSARRLIAAVRRALPSVRSPYPLRSRLKSQEPKSKREGISTKTSRDGHSRGGGRDTSRGDFG